MIAVYVDDITLAGKTDKRIKQVKEALAKCFKVKDMEELHYFLGIAITQDYENGKTWIAQSNYTTNVLTKFGMENSKQISTPVDVKDKLLAASEDSELVDQRLYQSAVGSFLYRSCWTRPDIMFAVNNVARFCSKHIKQHWTAVKCIIRYLRGTQNYCLLYTRDGGNDIEVYSDANWAGDVNDRKSTSRYLFTIGRGAVSWRSKKQTSVPLSTAEAEYMAFVSAAQEAIWIRQLNLELNHPPSNATVIQEDNQSAIAIAKNPQFHGRAKHIEIKYHFIREQIQKGSVELKYCPIEKMIADILKKGLPQDQFKRLRDMAGVKEIRKQQPEK